MDDFAIQASHPVCLPARGQRVRSLAEALPLIFPVETEEAYLRWNRIPVRISYKYDLYVLIDDVPPMLTKVMREPSGSHQVAWGSSTFLAEWQLEWAEGVLRMQGRWRSVAGNYESLLNSRPNLTVAQADFIAEWKELIDRLLSCVEASGITIERLSDLQVLRDLSAAIPHPGRLYHQPT